MMFARRLVTGVLGAALLGAVGGVAAPLAAHASAEVPAGAYDVAYPDLDMQATWTLTPCGPDCTSADSTKDGSFVDDWEFRLDNGRWTFTGPGRFECRPGVTAPADFDYGFDAVTLAGQGIATFAPDACGGSMGTSQTWSFQLTKVG